MSEFLPGRVLPSAPGGNVVALFGEIVVDVFPDRQALGGAPFNVARHLKAFGLHPILISRVGCDPAGQLALDAMRRFRMDLRGIQRDGLHATGQVLIRRNGDEPHFEIAPGRAYDFINGSVTRLVARGSAPSAVYFGTLAQRASGSRRALDSILRNIRAPCFLDINLRAPWFDEETMQRSLDRADIVKMNLAEFEQVARLFHLTGRDEATWAASLLSRFSLEKVVVTRGARGAWLLQSDGTCIEVEGDGGDCPVVDTIGAGDGFAAVILLGLLKGWPATTVLARADAFARAVCTIAGAIPMDEEFYRPFAKAWRMAEYSNSSNARDDHKV